METHGEIAKKKLRKESDKDFKSTKKLNWISAKTPFVKVNLIEYDHLLKVKKVDETMDFE